MLLADLSEIVNEDGIDSMLRIAKHLHTPVEDHYVVDDINTIDKFTEFL